MRTTLQNLINRGTPLVADGGMGTMLFASGLANGESPELWNVEHPDRVAAIQRAYIGAGAQIILTNTFGCNRFRLALHNLQDRAGELNRAAAAIAIAEAEAADHPVVVAGDIGPSGGILAPLGDLAYGDLVDGFEEQARALMEAGVDVMWVETMSDLNEVQGAVEACRRVDPDFPIVATMTFDTHGHTMMGVSPERALEALREMNLLALGANCGNGTAEIEGVIRKMRALDPTVVLVAKSNAGMPRLVEGRAVYDATPDIMARYALTVRELGADIIGACCGSTPEHIRAIAAALHSQVPT